MTTTNNQPTHIVYFVEENKEDSTKSKWNKIGAAWSHSDGKGFNIKLNMMPTDPTATLTMRVYEPKQEKTKA